MSDKVLDDQKQCLKGSLTNKLTRPERLIIVLYYYEEMTIKQIAEVLELSEACVSRMYSSIIARLRAEMNAKKSIFETAESSYQEVNARSNSTMLQHFTSRALNVTMVAKQEARRLNHEYIGTENLLLALVQEAGAVCRKIFNDFNITETNVRQETEKLVKSGTDLPIVDEGKLPHTPRAKNVIKYAVDEAQKLQRNYYVGTEHILLGLLRETDGVAYKVLTILGLELNEVQKKVLQLLGGSQS